MTLTKPEVKLIGTTIKNGALIISCDLKNNRALTLFQGEFVVYKSFNPSTLTVRDRYFYSTNLQKAVKALDSNRLNREWED